MDVATMAHINFTTDADLFTWSHADGVCKLIRVPREQIDEDSEETDAWDLLWIQASTNLRRFEVRLDPAYGRGDHFDGRDKVREYLATAPEEAAEILVLWA